MNSLQNAITKVSVYDQRVVDPKHPMFAVVKGSQSMIARPFQCTQPSASKLSYTILAPDTRSKLMKNVNWHNEINIVVPITVTAAGAALGVIAPLFTPGTHFAVRSFPMHSLVNNATVNINGKPFTENLNEYLDEILQLGDVMDAKYQCCPSQLDDACFYSDANSASISGAMLGNYSSSIPTSYVQNGAYNRVCFTDANGTPLPLANGTYNGIWYINGIPQNSSVAATRLVAGNYNLYIKITTDENLMMSPFTYQNSRNSEEECGLHGIGTAGLDVNINPDVSRILRFASVDKSAAGILIPAIAGNTNAATYATVGTITLNPNVPFQNSALNCQFFSPNEQLQLTNPVSYTPYLKFKSYTATASAGLAIGASAVMTINPQPLTSIPDGFLIYAKPYSYSTLTAGVANQGNVVGNFHFAINKIVVNFGDKVNQLQNYTREMIYQASINNGIDIEYNEFCGSAYGALGAIIPLSGSVVYLKANKDFALPSAELAPGVKGSFNFSMDVTIQNQTGLAINQPAVLYCVAVNSCMLASEGGQSEQIEYLLDPAEVLKAESLENPITDIELERNIGAGWLSKIGNLVSRAHKIYKATKPAISAIKGVLPDSLGSVKDAMGAVGYGKLSGGKKSRVKRMD